jgi:ferric-dicitrate binding protein FerR (iron transport regulator)
MDPALFAKLKSGDERAFERLFRESFAALVEETTPLVHGDGAAAARGVENVFAHVWSSREDFTTPEMLEAFLHQAVHEAAARINSRHVIAHQLAEHEGAHAPKAVVKPAPSVDDAWKKVDGMLHPNATHTADVAHDMAVQSRHAAADQLAEIAKPRSWVPFAAIAVVLIGLVGGFLHYANRGREMADLTAALSAADAHTSLTGMGEFSKVVLGDESSVNLGPDSKLKIPRQFGASVRGLELQGTATFTVAPGQKQRFIVRAGNTTVFATGTEFTVRAYSDEKFVAVRVRDGSVNVSVGDSLRVLETGASLIVAKDGNMHTPAAAEVEQAFGWTDGTVVATDRTVKEMQVIVNRWFGLQLFVTDSSLLDRKVSVRAKVGAGEAAIASIEKSGSVKRMWEGTNMVLKDGRNR